MTEYQIISGCKKNDRVYQRAFVDMYSPYLMGVCKRYIKDTARAQDCLQESLLKVMTSLHQYEEKGTFKSWASRVTANICLQNIRREKKHLNFELDTQVEASEQEKANLRLEVEDLMSFLDTIPVKYKIAVNMYIIEGYSHREIGDLLNITESSSRSLVARARKMIITAFEEEKMKVVHKNELKTPTKLITTNS